MVVDNYSAFFNCTPVGRASDSMMARHKAIHLCWLGPEFLVCCLAHRYSTFVCFFFCSGDSKLFGAQGSSGSLHNLFLSIMVFIMIYLFVHDDSLTSYRFTTRTEQLTQCCEQLQKLRVRVGTCNIDLSPQVILYY